MSRFTFAAALSAALLCSGMALAQTSAPASGPAGSANATDNSQGTSALSIGAEK
jgi:hypothetical protein